MKTNNARLNRLQVVVYGMVITAAIAAFLMGYILGQVQC